ncbi:soluble guanylate cyclase 88E-like isoform X1 [Biomphalaria glabrata]|uniref:guanylate cyclase n=1 Tax=Biomphalaria glabrata TaxID=6526 RepID=A0A9W3BL86_BIOGL|nr:soluble guanylate cyclase 88E-like isoform X1 [Biomphalaria glabrata]XP_055900176.1 soluble guanylate cyclase 88E-like isoform X1 [Biomphalaria glabrata]XP_055900177.1 soluble guanylate cyclase 88E-like isoform X1 [Biomphalaria glabrata]
MYGLLLQSSADFLKNKYGEELWEKIRKECNLTMSGFATHNIYSENIMVDMASAASKITGDTLETIMDCFGVEFVNFVGQFGYDRILKVLGRHMRDFLNGLDNLHEYLRFSYPKLKPPSFFVEDETKNGLTLTYRSRRKGFLHYVKGQIRQVGKVFYNTRVDIFVVANDFNEKTQTIHVKFRLLFDNKAFREVSNHVVDNIVDSIPLRPELLFELFPFHIVFSRKMDIRSVGPGLRAVIPSAVGKNMVDLFSLERPLTSFTWEDILHHTNNVFQLVARSPVTQKEETEVIISDDINKDPTFDEGVIGSNVLHLKGQMMYMTEWDCIMFLGTPIMNSLDDMFRIGLYINDLSMHDSSRDLVLAGTQQSAELKLALDQEQEKSRLLEQSMVKLDQEMQRTDALLYQMIPKPVADRLRRGVPSVETCQVFENVTILFSDVVGFTTICSQITPMEVVSMLNAMYTQFDQLSENHSVYKVETIGDAYMAVSGAPTVTKYHALHMCDMALDMRSSMNNLLNPSNNETMKIRIGIHTGTTVAGVVGIKMPRYCLFGDTVNTASRMETSGEAMKIHISETTRRELESYPYVVENRGSIDVKGKGQMKTYWLLGKRELSEKELSQCPFLTIMKEEVMKRNLEEHVDSNNSRLNADQHYSVSPHPYSPVSYRDFEDRDSPTGRKLSADADLLKLGATTSPRNSRSGPSGCPFAMGFFSASSTSESLKKPDNKNQFKGSIDITYSSVFENLKYPSKNNYKNQTATTGPSGGQLNSPRLSLSKGQKDIQLESALQYSYTPSIPESRDSGISVTEAHYNNVVGLSPSHVAAKNVTTSKEKDAAMTLHYVGSSPQRFSNEKQKNSSSKQSTPEAASTYHSKNIDTDSIIALDSRAASVTSQAPLEYTLNNTDGRLNKDTLPGNGSHKVAPLPHELDKFMPGKHAVSNGTIVIKNEFGCISGSCSDKHRADRKSKTCQIL